MEQCDREAGEAVRRLNGRGDRLLRVAWFSPLPPQRSGVAEYCEQLLGYLAEYMELDLFVEDPDLHAGTEIARKFPIHDFRRFRTRSRKSPYDVNIYQMGNDIVHRFVYFALVDNPGIVVLHEPMLHHFMLQMLGAGWTAVDYSKELDYNYGVVRDDIENIVATDPTELFRFRYPMIQRVVDSALGIVVHSEYARGEVLAHNPVGPVVRINHSYIPDPEVSGVGTAEARRRLGIDRDLFVIGTFGFVTPAKRIEAILGALRRLLPDEPTARLLVVGGGIPEYPLADVVRSMGLQEYVIIPGYVGWSDLMLYMMSCDIAVSLRWPSAGETPGGLIRLLGLGRPTITSNYKAFAEFPDDVCLKVDPERDEEELLSHLRRACRDRSSLEAMGERAGRYIAENFRPEDSAHAYAEFARSVISGGRYSRLPEGGLRGWAVRDAVMEDIADELQSMGVGPGFEAVLGDLSSTIDELF